MGRLGCEERKPADLGARPPRPPAPPDMLLGCSRPLVWEEPPAPMIVREE